jgi:hypothetical protein
LFGDSTRGGAGKGPQAARRIERGFNELDTVGTMKVEGKAVVIMETGR